MGIEQLGLKADVFVLMEDEKRQEPYYCSLMWRPLKDTLGRMKESVRAIKAGRGRSHKAAKLDGVPLVLFECCRAHFILGVFNRSLIQEGIFHLYLSAELKGSAQLFDREALARLSAESAVAHSCAGIPPRKHD